MSKRINIFGDNGVTKAAIENMVERGVLDDRDMDFLVHLQTPDVDVVDEVAVEGIARAVVHEIGSSYVDVYREIKGWFLAVESKRRYIEEICNDLVEWLEDKDRDYPDLNLDMGTIKTWLKTDEFYSWRYYFLMDDATWSTIQSDLRKDHITELEDLYDIDFKSRKAAGRQLVSAKTIKEMIPLVKKYRDRSNKFFEMILKRKTSVKSFPFQVILLGTTDLRRTVKRIVNMAI